MKRSLPCLKCLHVGKSRSLTNTFIELGKKDVNNSNVIQRLYFRDYYHNQ